MTGEPPRPRTSWAIRGFLPIMGLGYFVGLSLGRLHGNIGFGMGLGMAIGSILGLVVGLILHPEEFRWRQRSPEDRLQEPPSRDPSNRES